MILIMLIILNSFLFGDSCMPIYNNITNDNRKVVDPAPEAFIAIFNINIAHSEPVVIEVNRTWSPRGADRFHVLMRDGYYNCAAFYRVIPKFIAQFGIAAEPAETIKWKRPIKDDPVIQTNKPWTVSYATSGPNTRSTQLFINYGNNKFLDKQGFTPFGTVISGRDTVLNIVNPTPGKSGGAGVSQGKYTKRGNEWLLSEYPHISMIYTSKLG
mmetsp:Transcript_15850/g.26662  ORF Transcript_15850/g.26662 Transcript_15850/m.26662 type:complete len:213 (+) Transcript_15850:112-750(+)